MVNNDKIQLTGKVAKFPNNVKAVNALTYLENIKINPNKVWYILVENQENELKMVKYNRCTGVNLLQYTVELQQYYIKKYQNNTEIIEALNKLEVVGEKDFSVIKNIEPIVLENNQTLISKITTDLIKLLAK